VSGYLNARGTSAYCASKYALESFSDCLRREMFMWGLRVSIIEPGMMRTPIFEGHDHGKSGTNEGTPPGEAPLLT
jgi:NAD(P)-dependent dehydrogenase (short-subunit alcohol dehydrogenase family)